MDNEITLVGVSLVEVLLRGQLKHVVAHLEANVLHFRAHVFTRFVGKAESLICFAVNLGKVLFPLLLDVFEDVRGD